MSKKFVLNVKKGSTINHPAIGKLVGGVAIEVDDKIANQLKNIINVVVFDDIKLKNEI